MNSTWAVGGPARLAPVREGYQVTLEDVFLTDRGVAIIGVHTGGVIHAGGRGVRDDLRWSGIDVRRGRSIDFGGD